MPAHCTRPSKASSKEYWQNRNRRYQPRLPRDTVATWWSLPIGYFHNPRLATDSNRLLDRSLVQDAVAMGYSHAVI